MTFLEKLLTPFFLDATITPARLYACGSITLARLILYNEGGEFDEIITELTAALEALNEDLGGIGSSITIQKNATQSNSDVVALFKTTMSAKEGVIADKVGGFNTDAFREFYPYGQKEYAAITKTKMPTITTRVNTVATTYGTQLGTVLKTLLQSFKQMWLDSRIDQNTKITNVEGFREGKYTSLETVNNKMKKTLGVLWTVYDGDDAQVAPFFDFAKLFNPTKHKHIVLSGALAPPKGLKELANVAFDAEQMFNIQNTSTNASFIVYIVADPTDAPTRFVEVLPGKNLHALAPLLGDLTGTFLMIQSLSALNEATYIVEFLE